ncbi:MAG: MCE family protein [Variibacter sp.]|nr:MCE family protein [Variibacter sp.]
METRANYVLIGLFTLAIIVAAFGFVYWFSSGGVERERATYQVVFEGSVSGLRTGGSVLFNGIKVGEVTALTLNPRNPGQAVATVGIDKAIPIRTDTSATLEYQGLTGIAAIALKGGRADAPPLAAPAGEIPTIQAEPSAVQDLAQSAREVLGRAESVVRRIDGVLSDNEANVRNIVRNADRFMAALGDNADEVSAFIKDAAAAARRLATLSDNIDKLAADLSGVVRAVDPQRLQRTVENVERFSEALGRNAVHVDSLLKDAADVARKFNEMAASIDSTLKRVNDVAIAIDPAKIDRTVSNVEKFSDSLGRNSEQVDKLLKDAAEIARKFNEMTPRIDRILANVEGLTGSAEGKGMLSEISEAAKSVRKLAENMDKRVAEISTGLSRFTNSGLREWEALASEGRRTLGELERAVRNFDRNPQRLLFGGSGSGTVPQYGGRR